MRESPALEIIELLMAAAPRSPTTIPISRTSRRRASTRRADGHASGAILTPATLAGYDAALIVTDHDSVDYAALVRSRPLVVDTRNAIALDFPVAHLVARA